MPSAEQQHDRVRAWYALRRTLPPWRFEENLNELVACLPRYRVDEVIVKTDTEEFTHGQPLLPWVEAYVPNLERVRDTMAELGIVYSLNPWITVGHNDRGRDARRQLPGLRTMIGHDGAECTCCACPLSEVWREHVGRVWTLYAQTRPAVIWVEDDIRTFNHRPVTFGCFCPEHMKRFSERVGEEVSRKELVEAILKPGEPHPWRAEYLDMQADVMVETVAFLAEVVHAASPETRMGLMSSGPRNHCMEGRPWDRFADALADGRPLYSRPPMGNYHEVSLRGFYYSQDSIKITRLCMPDGTVEQTEVENVPFTQYSKSATFTFLEMVVSFAYGSDGVTMNLFDHCGTPMEYEPAFGRMLGERKDYLSALAERAREPGVYRGVRLLHHDRAAYARRLPPNAPYYALREDGALLPDLLETHGIPTTYEPERVAFTTGQQLRAFSDEEVRGLLKGGLFVDAVAAQVLVERGFGEMIGLASIDRPVCIDEVRAFSAEEFFNTQFGGEAGKYLTVTVPSLGGRPNFSRAALAEGAQVISRLVDPDAQRHDVCMYAWENELGGRVVVHLFDLATAAGVAFYHTFRREQLHGAVRWLSGGCPPVLVHGGVYPLGLRKDCEGRTLLGLLNLSLDPWPHVEWELPEQRTPSRLERLTQGGRWIEDDALEAVIQDGRLRVRLLEPVPFERPVFVTLEW